MFMNNQIEDQKRIVSLDVMRGFALLGILLANSLAFQFGMLGTYEPVDGMYQLGDLDRWTHFFIRLLVDGSFITLFSFLFGYGMSLQKLRITNYTPVFWRRTSLLLLFGLLHLFLIWRGDILLGYSLAAMVLFAFLFLSTRSLLISNIIWFLIMALFVLVPDIGNTSAPYYYLAEQNVITEGTYIDHILFRLTHDLLGISTGNGFLFLIGEFVYQFNTILVVMPMFLLGAYAARKKWFVAPSSHLRLFKICLPIALIVGMAAKLPNAITGGSNTQLESLSVFIGAPALALFYAGMIAIIVDKTGSKRFAPLAAVGRMAFTNYISQSVCFTFFFYGYGLGFFSELGIFYGALLSLAFFTVQLIASLLWLRWFKMGPLEWLWRAGTYLRLPKMKRY